MVSDSLVRMLDVQADMICSLTYSMCVGILLFISHIRNSRVRWESMKRQTLSWYKRTESNLAINCLATIITYQIMHVMILLVTLQRCCREGKLLAATSGWSFVMVWLSEWNCMEAERTVKKGKADTPHRLGRKNENWCSLYHFAKSWDTSVRDNIPALWQRRKFRVFLWNLRGDREDKIAVMCFKKMKIFFSDTYMWN